jgi:hypothetical protein
MMPRDLADLLANTGDYWQSLDTIPDTVPEMTDAAVRAEEAAALALTAIPYNGRSAFTAATVAADLKSWSVVHPAAPHVAARKYDYVADATGTAIQSANGIKGSPAGKPSSGHWGAGAGTSSATNDSAALTAAFAWSVPRGETLLLEGLIFVHETVPIVGAPRMYMEEGDDKSRIVQHLTDRPTFDVQLSGATVNYPLVQGIRADCTGLASNPACGFMKFTGDTNIIADGCIARNQLNSYYYGFKSEKLPRTTTFGLEGGLNWIGFRENQLATLMYGYWFAKGSGTGNTFIADRPAIRDGGSYIYVEGSAGCVVGDIVIVGLHGRSASGTAACVTIGDGMAYGGALSITASQFDAGMDEVVVCPDDVSWNSWTIAGNTYSANVNLGSTIAPLMASVVVDKDVSRWEVGHRKASNTIGAMNLDLFEVEFREDNIYNGVNLHVKSSTQVGGRGMRVSSAEFDLATDGTTMTVREVLHHADNTTGSVTISVVATTAFKATVSIAASTSDTGSSTFTTMTGSGGPQFKISRIV